MRPSRACRRQAQSSIPTGSTIPVARERSPPSASHFWFWSGCYVLCVLRDISPTGLSRALVAQGVKVLGHRLNPGLAALADRAGVTARPDAYHLGFVLGPRINA